MDKLFTPDEFIDAVRDTLPHAVNEMKFLQIRKSLLIMPLPIL